MSLAQPTCPGRARRALLLGVVLVGLLPAVARANDLDVARVAWEAGRKEEARARLLDVLIAGVRDPDDLLAATRLAAATGDLDLIERAQGQAEIALGEEPGPAVRLALAIASLAHAETRLAQGDRSSDLAFLFADAESYATTVADHVPSALAAQGVHVLASARQAQGDLAGALRAIDERPGAVDDAVRALHGRLLYAWAVGGALDAEGRPTEEGRAALERAATLILGARDLPAADAARSALVRAWALHRLGRLPEASEAYLTAHGLDPTTDLAIRGLESLWAGRTDDLIGSLRAVLAYRPADGPARAAEVRALAAAGDDAEVRRALERWTEAAPDEAEPWLVGGRYLASQGAWAEAADRLARALALDAVSRAPVDAFEQVARAVWANDVEAGLALYDRLLALRPGDPFLLNNLGFLLREAVSPWTTMDERTGLQRIRPEAPPRVRELLDRSVGAYRDAVALIPEAQDADLDPDTAWNLAGIVNDYGLMLHYFEDVQDAAAAERLYLRALRMTDHAFQDSYVPNLRRLYAFVLPGHELTWYRTARAARDAILQEVQEAGGTVRIPDEAKRRLAEEDVIGLRGRLAEELAGDAGADGEPWPPR